MKKSDPIYQGFELYDWSNIPLSIWLKLHSDLSLLVVSGKPKEEDLLNGWLEVFQGYIDQCGLSGEYKKTLDLSRRLVLLEIDYALTKKAGLKTKIKILRLEVLGLSKEKPDNSLEVAIIERYLKFPIDEDNIKAKKYYGYINLMKQEHERNKERGNN